MQFAMFLLTAFAGSAVVALRPCGVPEPTEDQMRTTQELYRLEQERFLAMEEPNLPHTAINISIYWHIIMLEDAVESDNLTRAALESQLQVLNDAYSPHNIFFTEAGADWTINDDWAELPYGDFSDTPEAPSLEMAATLRQGHYDDLNVYFVQSASYVGISAFPGKHESDSMEFQKDGIILLSNTIPNGTYDGYNMGKTLVHETGHWLGLFHTFANGCDGDGSIGDFIDDTPAELVAARGCPNKRDTCPEHAGLDPIHNYMDYTDDSCRTEFTRDQVSRMKTCWLYLRSGYSDQRI